LNLVFATLRKYLRWYCCRRNKFAIKTLFCNAQYFNMADSHVQFNKAQNAVLPFRFNIGYANAP